MNINIVRFASVVAAILLLCSGEAFAERKMFRNMPSKCPIGDKACGCSEKTKTGTKVTSGCIKVYAGLGESTPWTGSMECALKIFADNDSPSIFTADSLYAVLGGYTFKRLGTQNLADGTTPAEVVLSHENGEPIHFVFRDGESMARPDPGVHIKMDERLQMVDAEGWATTSDPVYYDLYVGDGTKRRFLATDMTGALGSLVSITDARGVAVTPADMGVDIVYDSNGVRQFLTPSRLADIVQHPGFTGYDVKVYAIAEAPSKIAATGLYEVPNATPANTLTVRRENDGKRAVVTVASGGNDPRRYVFDYVFDDWSLTHPSGAEDRKERKIDDERSAQLLEGAYSASGVRLSRAEYNFKWESWGFAMTNRVEGFDGVTDTTEWTYYTSGNGKGQVKTEKRQSGLLIQYAYDNLDRIISESRSGPDMMTETTTYDYTPVDPSDPVLPVDTRPRTVVKTLNGIECERTYYVYSPLTNIVERVGTQGAAFGGTNILRTVTAFYPAVANDVRSGLVSSIRHEDGKLDVYDYSLVTNLWVETVTHLHEQSPAPVSGKTTREVTFTNARGENIEQKTEAFIDGIWYTIARNRMTYNEQGKRTSLENLAGQVTTTAWDCCHKVSEVQPDGSTTTWDYDDEGRVIASSRLIPLDMTNVTWLTTCYKYDDLGRQTATWQTNYAAQVGLPATRTRYDALGRVIARVDQLGNTTTTTYSPDGRTVSVHNPNTSTRITSRSASGDTLSITGSAVTPEFHTYGILPDGTRWSRIVQGETPSSPRFTKRYENLLGLTIREERSGFQRAVLATTHSYDSYGRIVSTSPDYEPTVEYTYSVYGGRNAFISSADKQWRRSELSASFVLNNDMVWYLRTNYVSCSDAKMEAFVSSSGIQLTGLSAEVPFRSYSIDERGNCSENRLLISSQNVTSIRIVPYVDNVSLTVTRYGLDLQTVSIQSVTNTVAYDFLGRPMTLIDGRGCTRKNEYNTFGLQVAVVDALQNRTEHAYTHFGDIASTTDPLGQSKNYEYDLARRKTYEGGAAYPVRYTYDVFGNKTMMMTYRNESLGPDSGDVTTWLYDEPSGLLTNKLYASGKGPSYSYTPNGKIARRIWARGITTDYFYDGWGNLTNIVYSDDTPTVSMLYDAMGRQTNVVDAAGVTTFTYDKYGAVTNETVASMACTNSLMRYWDAYGRTEGYALNGIRQTTIGYDIATGRIVSMMANGAGAPFTWSYFPGSDIKSSLVYPNGLRASWQHDASKRLQQVCNVISTNVISQYDYSYDKADRRVRCSHSGVAFDQPNAMICHYNSHSELTNVVSFVDALYSYSYEYDDVGNRKSAVENGVNYTCSANQLNQYSSVGDFAPRYDEDGNQTLIKTPTGVWSLAYDGENRPVSWVCGATNVTMAFDYRGRRIAKGAQHFVYDNFLQIADSSGNTYVWDPTESVSTRPLIWNCVGRVAYYVHDGRKNVSEIIDGENGRCVAHYEYAPYGLSVVSRGELSLTNHWRWSSEYADDDIGVVYYNYRNYDYLAGRWMSLDIIEEKGGINLYAFIDNDPCNHTDYLGMGQSGMIECGGNCKICLDNDAGSGDGNTYKIHWACSNNRMPRNCREGDRTGSARLPDWLPSHGTTDIPDKIKECVKENTKWIEKTIKAPIPIQYKKCCKDVEFKTYELTFPSLPNFAPQPEVVALTIFTCVGLLPLMVLLAPVGI